MTDASSPSPFENLWLSETIRLREEHAGPLEDAEANRLARTEGGDLTARIQRRALLLARRDGQWQALQHWLQGARLAGLLLALLALLSGIGLALAAFGDGSQAVNVFWAMGSLLGLNLLMLIGWALGVLLSRDHPGTLGRLWLWLSEKLARDASAAQLAPALLLMLQRQRLTRWGLGLMVNGLWTLAMLAALTTALLLLATRRYGFVWETTILGGDTFISLTQAIGALPALFGFSLPDVELIRASGDAAIASEAARQSWAGWLVGVLLVYGLLPRLLLTLLCLWRWHSGKRTLRLHLALPGYDLLRQRLQPGSERLGVCDLAPAALHQPQGGSHALSGNGALLLGLELDDRRPWPPATLPKGVADAGVIDSREQRRQLLEQLTRFPPERLVIACDPLRSPDRGTLALIGELARSASATRIWLLAPAPGTSLDSERLRDWHQAVAALGLTHSDTAPLSWLESGHD
ncbi:DUF2868 domain-containing protein [Pseudomonas sp. SH1-B]